MQYKFFHLYDWTSLKYALIRTPRNVKVMFDMERQLRNLSLQYAPPTPTPQPNDESMMQ